MCIGLPDWPLGSCYRERTAASKDGLTSSKSIQQSWQHIIREMIQKLRHRIYPFLAGRTSWDDDTLTALSHAWGFIDKRGEVVSADFSLQGLK
jgi:hypothetical protein